MPVCLPASLFGRGDATERKESLFLSTPLSLSGGEVDRGVIRSQQSSAALDLRRAPITSATNGPRVVLRACGKAEADALCAVWHNTQ